MLRRAFVAFVMLLLPALASAQSAQNPSFNVVNRGTSAINEVYATPAGMTSWGRDRLGRNAVPPGQTFAVRLPADGNCLYDVRVVYANGQSDERRGLNTCAMDNLIFPAPTGTGTRQQAADDPSFRLVNRSKSEINEVYASLAGVDSWGTDRLGDDTVAPGATKVIRLPNGPCIYDVRIVYANGEATEKRRLNLCTITDLRVP